MLDDDDDDTIFESPSKSASVGNTHSSSNNNERYRASSTCLSTLEPSIVMSYASANVQTSGSGAPHVGANFTTDPDKARKERAKDQVHRAEDRAKTWYHQASDKIWMPGVAVR